MKKSEILIDALAYIKKFKGKIFVIKLGGQVMLDKKVMDTVAQDLILLNYVGIKSVVLHGGGPEISAAMEKFGKKPKFIEGLRVTDEETMDIVKMVLIGKINSEIVGCINKHGGINAVGLSGKSANLFFAEKKTGKVDLGMVGDIKKVNAEFINLLIDKNYIPVISSVALDKAGNALNINADTAAGQLASALKAAKLILLTDVPGVLDENNNLIKRITVPEIDHLIKSKKVSGGMIPKLSACKIALENGVKRTHIIKAVEHGILEEVFTSYGTGTMLTLEKVVGG